VSADSPLRQGLKIHARAHTRERTRMCAHSVQTHTHTHVRHRYSHTNKCVRAHTHTLTHTRVHTCARTPTNARLGLRLVWSRLRRSQSAQDASRRAHDGLRRAKTQVCTCASQDASRRAYDALTQHTLRRLHTHQDLLGRLITP